VCHLFRTTATVAVFITRPFDRFTFNHFFHLVIFACLFHRILHFGLFSCRYFHCVAEHCVCFVTSKNFQADLIVECCTIQLLEIDTKTISNSLCNCCDTCSIVSKSVGTVTVLNNNFSSKCLFIFCTNIVIIVTVVDVHCSFRCWWLVCCAGFECFTLSRFLGCSFLACLACLS